MTFADDHHLLRVRQRPGSGPDGFRSVRVLDGQRQPEPHTGTTAGFYDLHGNLCEWTETIGTAITSGNYMTNDITVPVGTSAA